MKYIIADPDKDSSGDLKRILDENKILVFQGSFTTLKAAEAYIRGEPPDIAFIRLGNAELNAFCLTGEIKRQNPLTKVIFFGSHKENAVEAFEYEVNGFLLEPFDKKKVRQMCSLWEEDIKPIKSKNRRKL